MAGFGVNALIRKDALKRIGDSLCVYAFVVAAIASQVDASVRPAVVVSGLFLVAVVPALLWRAWLISRRYQIQWGSALLFALVSFEAYLCASPLGFIHFWSAIRSEPPSIKWLADHVGHERIFGLRGVLPADTLVPYRIRDIRHLDALYPDLYLDYVSAIWPSARSDVFTSLAESLTIFEHPFMGLSCRAICGCPSIRCGENLDTAGKIKYTVAYEDKMSLFT